VVSVPPRRISIFLAVLRPFTEAAEYSRKASDSDTALSGRECGKQDEAIPTTIAACHHLAASKFFSQAGNSIASFFQRLPLESCHATGMPRHTAGTTTAALGRWSFFSKRP
jgi:hypothetical protein